MSKKTRISAEVKLTPEQVAEAFWNFRDDEQAVFFAHLYRIAGSMLCRQMSALSTRLADMDRAGDRDAWAGFKTMAMHSNALVDSNKQSLQRIKEKGDE